jgi:hypothetical protein
MTQPDPEPSQLNQSLGIAVNNLLQKQATDVIDRLRRKYGLGANPAKRMAFYQRVQEIVDKHGDPAYEAVSEAVAQSVGKLHPDRYFCKAVANKLKELKIWTKKEPW